MIKLEDVTFLDLAPPNFARMAHVKALSYALDLEYKNFITAATEVIVYARVMQLDSLMLDALAKQFDIVGYRQALLLQSKRKLVQQSILTAMMAGTIPATLEQAKTIFGDLIVEEWFQYGGEPGYFRIKAFDPNLGDEALVQFSQAIRGVKRLSAWLEAVIIDLSADMNIYVGHWPCIAGYDRLKPMTPPS